MWGVTHTFLTYSANLSKVHSYTVIGSLLFYSIIDKVFSITHAPLTKLGALMNNTEIN